MPRYNLKKWKIINCKENGNGYDTVIWYDDVIVLHSTIAYQARTLRTDLQIHLRSQPNFCRSSHYHPVVFGTPADTNEYTE